MNENSESQACRTNVGHELGARLWMMELTQPVETRRPWCYSRLARLVGLLGYVRRCWSLPRKIGLDIVEHRAFFTWKDRAPLELEQYAQIQAESQDEAEAALQWEALE